MHTVNCWNPEVWTVKCVGALSLGAGVLLLGVGVLSFGAGVLVILLRVGVLSCPHHGPMQPHVSAIQWQFKLTSGFQQFTVCIWSSNYWISMVQMYDLKFKLHDFDSSNGGMCCCWSLKFMISDGQNCCWSLKFMISDGQNCCWSLKFIIGEGQSCCWSLKFIISDGQNCCWSLKFIISDVQNCCWSLKFIISDGQNSVHRAKLWTSVVHIARSNVWNTNGSYFNIS